MGEGNRSGIGFGRSHGRRLRIRERRGLGRPPEIFGWAPPTVARSACSEGICIAGIV